MRNAAIFCALLTLITVVNCHGTHAPSLGNQISDEEHHNRLRESVRHPEIGDVIPEITFYSNLKPGESVAKIVARSGASPDVSMSGYADDVETGSGDRGAVAEETAERRILDQSDSPPDASQRESFHTHCVVGK